MTEHQEFTSMSRARFEELRQGILDGTLAEQWRQFDGVAPESLARKKRVEFRQLSYIVALANEGPETLHKLLSTEWRRLRVFTRGQHCITEVIR